MRSTYEDIKGEVKYELSMIREAINFGEYFSSRYFKQSFLDEMKVILKGMEKCNCSKDFISVKNFESMLIDTCISYREREDIVLAISQIFSSDFINTKQIGL
jgi:hypothetical protein